MQQATVLVACKSLYVSDSAAEAADSDHNYLTLSLASCKRHKFIMKRWSKILLWQWLRVLNCWVDRSNGLKYKRHIASLGTSWNMPSNIVITVCTLLQAHCWGSAGSSRICVGLGSCESHQSDFTTDRWACLHAHISCNEMQWEWMGLIHSDG